MMGAFSQELICNEKTFTDTFLFTLLIILKLGQLNERQQTRKTRREKATQSAQHLAHPVDAMETSVQWDSINSGCISPGGGGTH